MYYYYFLKGQSDDLSKVTMEVHINSWTNYCDLFDGILSSVDADSTFDVKTLFDQWSWDIISEFVYQFQTFCEFRTHLSSRTEEEIEFLRENETVWQAQKVLNYIHRIISKSNIKEILKADKEGRNPPT